MEPREQLLALAARLPVSRPWDAFDASYVPRPQGVGDNIASSLLADPSGTHAIVGSIGSGKSTELYRAATQLRDDPRLVVVCADADLLGDGLGHAAPGVVLRKVAQALAASPPVADLLTIAGQQAADRVRRRAEREADGPFSSLDPTTSTDLDDLGLIVAALGSRRAIVLLDSFDRVLPADGYVAAIEDDLATVRRAGVGLVLTAPVDLLFLHWRQHLALFSAHHLLGVLDPSVSEHRSFLRSVLDRRDPDGLIADPVRDALVDGSGGHLRHLIQLAHGAVTYAVRAKRPLVAVADADQARAILYTFLASAMSGDQSAILDEVARGGTPARATDDLVSLVRDARLFDEGRARYRIHPALLAPPARRVA